MYIAVCDDQPQELEAIAGLLEEWRRASGAALRFRAFQNAAQLLDAAERERFDVYLLDVIMPDEDGIAAAREIRGFDAAAEIVFLTSSPDFAYQSYSVRAFDYLLKPAGKQTLFDLLDRLLLQSRERMEGLTLKCGPSLIRVLFSQIVYVEVHRKHLYFHLTDGSAREVFGALNEYAPALLGRPEFMQTHRSYIVNMLHAAELSPAGLRTFSGRAIPVSRLVYPQLKRDYLELMFNGGRESL